MSHFGSSEYKPLRSKHKADSPPPSRTINLIGKANFIKVRLLVFLEQPYVEKSNFEQRRVESR